MANPLRYALSGLVLVGVVIEGMLALSAPFPSKLGVVMAVLGVALAVFLALRDRRRLVLRVVGLSAPLAAVAFWVGSPPSAFHYGGAQEAIELGVMDLLLLPLLAVLLLELFEGRRRLRLAEEGMGLLLAFLTWAAVSIVVNENYLLGFNELFRVSRIFLGYVIVSQLVDGVADLRLLLRWLACGAVVQALVAFYQYRFGTPSFLQVHGIGEAVSLEARLSADAARVGGLVGYATSFAQYLSIMMPIALGLSLTARRAAARWSAVAAVLLVGVALLLTFTRGVLIIMPVCILAVVFIVVRRVNPRWLFIAVGLTIVLMGGLLAATSQLVLRRFDETATAATGRLEMDIVAFRIIQANPMLGVGLNNYAEAKVRYDSRLTASVPWPVHNLFLFFAAEVGLPGMVLITAFIWLTYARGIRLYRLLPSHDGAMVAAMLVGYSAPLLYGQIDQGFKFVPALWWTLWILSGAVTALAVRYPANGSGSPSVALGHAKNGCHT